MKFTGIIAGALALALASSASAQVSAPIYKSANTPLPAQGVFLLDTAGNAAGSSVASAATSGQLAGTPISLPAAGGVQIQIAGLSADTLAITQGMGPNCTTATYVTATVLKQDLTTTAASALTGTAANGIYSVMVFGGCLKITRTGTADTLTVSYRGTN